MKTIDTIILAPEKEFDVTQVMGNAFAFVQDLNTEIYKVMGKRDGHYIFTLVFDRNNNKTELTIEEVSDGPSTGLEPDNAYIR